MDTPTTSAPAVAPGKTTTEYALARAASILCFLVTLAGLVNANLPASLQQNKDVGLTMVIVGIVGKVLTSLGYMTARAAVKSAAAAAAALFLLLPLRVQAQSVSLTGTASVGKSLTLNWGPVTSFNFFTVARNASGQPAILYFNQGGGGLQLDLGFDADRWHLSLAGEGTGAGAPAANGQVQAYGGLTFGLAPGWGGFGNVPLFSLGPATFIPIGAPSGSRVSFALMASISALNLIHQWTGL